MQAATEAVAVVPVAPAVTEAEGGAPAGATAAAVKVPRASRARMMRQYDLVERVRSYNPNTDEDMLNRAYVYAMVAHGEQTRASGDPYFTHPLEVAAILTDLKLDDATIVAALLLYPVLLQVGRQEWPESVAHVGHEKRQPGSTGLPLTRVASPAGPKPSTATARRDNLATAVGAGAPPDF
eukprot:gene36905-49786_t